MIAWVFDVDGVITSLQTRKVEHPKIIQKIVEKLERGEPVGIITGSELPWLLKNVIEPIEQQTRDKQILDLLHIETEFGGVSVTYLNGIKHESVDNRFSLPQELLEKAGKIVEVEFNDLVFIPPKQTHFTAELKWTIDPKDFKERQKKLAEKLQELVDELGLSEQVDIHQDALAVNIRNKKLNKHLAADKSLEWLSRKGLEPDFFYVFGDSQSDLEIGSELHNQGKKLKFIYTGKDDVENYPFEIIKSNKLYDEGTLEYLLGN